MRQQFVFDRFGGDLVAGEENDQVLDTADDAPVPCPINLSLVAGVKPAVTQRLGSFLRAIPVAGENIRAAHDDFVVLAQLHFDSTDRRAHAAGLHMPRMIHGADGSCLGETVNL